MTELKFTAHLAGKTRKQAKYIAQILIIQPQQQIKLMSATPERTKKMVDMIKAEYRELLKAVSK